MSAINFKIDLDRVPDPAGDRVRITLDGDIQTTFNVHGLLYPSMQDAMAAALDAAYDDAQPVLTERKLRFPRSPHPAGARDLLK